MLGNRVFLEHQKSPDIAVIDKKRYLIENQKVLPRKGLKKGLLGRGFPIHNLKPATFSEILNLKKNYLFFICVSFIFLFSLLPLLNSARSYFWEKNRFIIGERNIIYDLFLKEGIDFNQDQKEEYKGRYYSIPTLKSRYYRITDGDSLYSISNKFNVSIDAIITANNLKNAYILQTGTKLKIPNISGIFHEVSKGESLSSISEKYNVSINRIADFNDLPSSIISVGQRIFVPGGALTSWQRALVLGNIFKKPSSGKITSKLGFRIDPFTKSMAYHAGIDIANRIGTPVYASQFGRVIYTGFKGNYGKTIIIVHPQGFKTLYAHLDKIYVKRGQAVKQGEKIGSVGNSGRSTGPHLHFEIQERNKILDPLKFMR